MERAVSSSLLDSRQDPLRSWLCPPEFRLGIGDEWEGPIARQPPSRTSSTGRIARLAEQDTGALSPRRLDDAADVDDLLLIASQALESATGNENALPGASGKDRFSTIELNSLCFVYTLIIVLYYECDLHTKPQ